MKHLFCTMDLLRLEDLHLFTQRVSDEVALEILECIRRGEFQTHTRMVVDITFEEHAQEGA